ncbi:MAG TPA: MFS transporter [Pseudonocardiaceae bacterium]|nr:MFS transporter [Pseudonocardiaceae bacterium]
MSHQATTEAPGSQVSPRRWLVLGIVLAAAFMILLDATIVNVALPTMQRGLHTSDADVQWVGAGYALTYGLILIPAGRFGDRIGHRHVLLFGIAAFTVSSALCGAATSGTSLVAWRLVQGAAAGVLNAPIIALIQSVFPPRELGRAFSAYGVIAGLATAIGPLAGGLLIDGNLVGLSWRPIFLINIPIGLIVLALAVRFVPQARGRAGGVDPVGMLIVALGLSLIIVPLVAGGETSWPAWKFVALGLAVPVLAGFALWERARVRANAVPLVDVRLFARLPFTAGVLIATVHFAAFVGLAFTFSLYLQLGLKYSALASGLVLTAFAAGTMVGGAVSDPLAANTGRTVLHIGTGLLGIGIAGIWTAIALDGGQPIGWVLPGLLVAGVGNGVVIGPITSVVLDRVGGADAGAVSATLTATERIGQALGTAVLGTVLFNQLGSALRTGTRLVSAYDSAIGTALLGALCCTALAFLLVFALPRNPIRSTWDGQSGGQA